MNEYSILVLSKSKRQSLISGIFKLIKMHNSQCLSKNISFRSMIKGVLGFEISTLQLLKENISIHFEYLNGIWNLLKNVDTINKICINCPYAASLRICCPKQIIKHQAKNWQGNSH